MKKLTWLGLMLALAGFGCGLTGTNNDVRPVEVALSTGVSLGQAATIALSAMNGSGSVACAHVVAECSEYPCDGEVEIVYGGGCPLPLGGEAVGATTVSGTWSDADTAALNFTFTDVSVSGRGSILASATTIAAQREGDTVTVEYTGSQAAVRGIVALAAASHWEVVVNDSGTPDDPSDDSYTIDGTTAAAGGVSGGSLSVEEVLITPDCRRNPVAGTARIVEGGLTNIRTDEVTFHAACDGTARLDHLSGTDTIGLDFLD